MGREIRKVPPNWKHPEKEEYSLFNPTSERRLIPMYDKNYDDAVNEWNDGIILWNKGEHPVQIEHRKKIIKEPYKRSNDTPEDLEITNRLNNPEYYSVSNGYNYWDYFGMPPKEERYHKFKSDEATWFQLYETVSEGTPVTPPFATREELADYLAENGDFWDQKRRKEGNSFMDCNPWGKEAAYKFVFGGGYMPSMITANGKCLTGGELANEMYKDKETTCN